MYIPVKHVLVCGAIAETAVYDANICEHFYSNQAASRVCLMLCSATLAQFQNTASFAPAHIFSKYKRSPKDTRACVHAVGMGLCVCL